MQGDEHYYEQAARLLEDELQRTRAVVERVTKDLEDHEAAGNEAPTVPSSELRAGLGSGFRDPIGG